MTEHVVLENGTKTAKESFTSVADDRSAELVRGIEAFEEELRAMRGRINKIRARRKQLVSEIEQIDEALEAENDTFALKLNSAISSAAESAFQDTQVHSSPDKEPTKKKA